MTGTFQAACVQMRSARSLEANLRDATAMIRDAAAAGADLIMTPEMTGQMESDRARLEAETFLDDGHNPSLMAFERLAGEIGRWLLIGSLAVKVGDGRLANRSYLIGPDGRTAARYDKIHMFDVDVSQTEQYRESRTYRPGAEAITADLPWGRLGMTVCYDVRFPYLYRALAEAGAVFLSVPSAFTRVTGQAHWHVLLRARAIETGCFVFAPAQAGRHENERETYGHSLIIGPWGEILAEAGEEPCIVMARIDPGLVSAARRRIPSLKHGVALGPPPTKGAP